MMVMCGSLRLFWYMRRVFLGVVGRRDVEEI